MLRHLVLILIFLISFESQKIFAMENDQVQWESEKGISSHSMKYVSYPLMSM